MVIKSQVENYALYLKRNCNDRQLHDLVNAFEADEDIMDAWNLSEDDYFYAVEIACFTPEIITATVH
jgi:hypothetical protein